MSSPSSGCSCHDPHPAPGSAVGAGSPEDNIPVYATDILEQEYSRFLIFVALIVGVFILFSTQLGIFEALVRNFVAALNATSRG